MTPGTSSTPTARLRARLSYLALAVLAGCTAQASCGGKLDHGKLERDVTAKLKELTGLEAKVTCPKGHKAKKDDTFTCDVMLEGAMGKVSVVQNDDKGNVHWNLTEGFVLGAKVEGAIKDKLASVAKGEVQVDCGAKVRASVPGEVFRCQARDEAGGLAIDVTITDATGAIDWKAVQPADAPAPADGPAPDPQ